MYNILRNQMFTKLWQIERNWKKLYAWKKYIPGPHRNYVLRFAFLYMWTQIHKFQKRPITPSTYGLQKTILVQVLALHIFFKQQKNRNHWGIVAKMLTGVTLHSKKVPKYIF